MIPHLVALVVGHALEALRLGVEVALLAAVRLNKCYKIDIFNVTAREDLLLIQMMEHPRPQTCLTQKSVPKHVVSYKRCMKPSRT